MQNRSITFLVYTFELRSVTCSSSLVQHLSGRPASVGTFVSRSFCCTPIGSSVTVRTTYNLDAAFLLHFLGEPIVDLDARNQKLTHSFQPGTEDTECASDHEMANGRANV